MLRAIAPALAALLLPAVAPAQTADPAPAPSLTLSLTQAVTEGDQCRLAFEARNLSDVDLADVQYTFAFMRDGGALDRLLRLGFQDLWAGRRMVRQFSIDGLSCDAIAEIFLNEESACVAAGADEAGDLCDIRRLEVSVAAGIPILFGSSAD